jgi:CO/xanthine dehydrogenase Mo-binding subunit
MGGCFGGGSQYTDTAVAAGLMSQAMGAPVRVQLMRWDEIGWTRNGPASLMDVRAGIDSQGNLVAMDLTAIYPQYVSTLWPSSVLAGAPLPTPTYLVPNGSEPMYSLPNHRYTVKLIQITGNWVTGSALRSVGAHASTSATVAL